MTIIKKILDSNKNQKNIIYKIVQINISIINIYFVKMLN